MQIPSTSARESATAVRQSFEPEPLAYSIAETCRVVGVGKTTVYELIAAGQLESVMIGRRRLIKAASLKQLLETGC